MILIIYECKWISLEVILLHFHLYSFVIFRTWFYPSSLAFYSQVLDHLSSMTYGFCLVERDLGQIRYWVVTSRIFGYHCNSIFCSQYSIVRMSVVGVYASFLVAAEYLSVGKAL